MTIHWGLTPNPEQGVALKYNPYGSRPCLCLPDQSFVQADGTVNPIQIPWLVLEGTCEDLQDSLLGLLHAFCGVLPQGYQLYGVVRGFEGTQEAASLTFGLVGWAGPVLGGLEPLPEQIFGRPSGEVLPANPFQGG